MNRLDLGLFLPIASNGFVFSRNAPAYPPSYRDNLEIALEAERIGFDYIFSMAKWRGFGGDVAMWDSSFDSFSLMLGLAAKTERVDLVATVNPLLFHPAVMAKMAATFDDVSNGRLALNLITGGLMGEYHQMGVVPPDYEANRYAYAAEWIQVVKRLWSEERVTHDGRYFSLDDCVSDPKPLQKPHPRLICAATSDEGLRFTAREADWCFISGRDIPGVGERARRARAIAAEEGASLKTALLTMLVIGDDQADAMRRAEHLIDGADIVALTNAGLAQASDSRARTAAHGAQRLADHRQIFFGLPIIGGPVEIAEQLLALARDNEVDSIAVIFPDYKDGLQRFETGVLPLLRRSIEVGFQHSSSEPAKP